MNIAIFGATGKTGQRLTEQALALGHRVTALARTPSKLTLTHENLHVLQGDVYNQADVAKAVLDQEAVICSLGSNSLGKTDVRSQGTANIVAAMQQSAVERLIVISSLGSGDSIGQATFAAKLFMRTLLRNVLLDHGKQEKLVMDSALNYTIIRPSGLTDEPKTGSYQHGLASDTSIQSGRIARADVAAFALEMLDSAEYSRQAVSIT